MTSIDVHMANGESLKVKGTLQEAEKALEDAARSGQSRLAWMIDAETETPIGINPAQVTSIRAAGGAD